MKNRWSDRIQKDVNKFAGCVNQIQKQNPSGTNSGNRLTMAMSLFSNLYEKPFVFLSCYELLSASPKWNDYCRDLDKKKEPTSKPSKRTTSEKPPTSDSTQTPAMSAIGTSDLGEKLSSGDETCGPPGRPIGRKRAKIDHTANIVSNKNQESFKKMAVAHGEIAESSKKQNQILEAQQEALTRLADESIMCKDLTGMSDSVKRFYEFQQKKILKRMEAEMEEETKAHKAEVNEP